MASGRDEATGFGVETLARLAEGDRPIGPRTRMALAYALGVRNSGDRLLAAEALMPLARRTGGLAAVGETAATLVQARFLSASRLADTLGHVFAAGAYTAVREVMAGLLPGVLSGERRTGMAEILGLAAESAARVGAGEPIAGLDGSWPPAGNHVPWRRGRRLRGVLTSSR